MDLTCWAHDASDFEVYIDPALINGNEGDFAELWVPQSRIKRNLYFIVRKPTKSVNAISVNSQVLAKLGIRPRSSVRVRVLPNKHREHAELDVVEIHFTGVYLTRYDHYQIAKKVNGGCVIKGQKLDYLSGSVRLTVENLFRNGKQKFSGVVGENTRLVFRSDSARILIFVQMSKEMYNFDETGDIMFHKLVNSFIPEMLHQWHAQGDSHLVSIVLFTSIRVRPKHGGRRLHAGELEPNTLHFYRVVVDSVHISRWSDIMGALRAEFARFMAEVLVDPETNILRGTFLPSSKSNLLEAFSLATTLLTNKFVDRDLCHTGVQAMVVTAGPACFDVDLSELWQLSRRLLGVEIGIELVCLARPPLHITPLFRSRLPSSEPLSGGGRIVFCVPTWINMSFWTAPGRFRKQWIPRCKIYDLQMVGILESEPRTLGLHSNHFAPNDLTLEFMKQYDAQVFKSVKEIETQKKVESAAKTARPEQLRPVNTPTETPTTVVVEARGVTAQLTEPSTKAADSLGALLRKRTSMLSLKPTKSNASVAVNESVPPALPSTTAPVVIPATNTSIPTRSIPITVRNSRMRQKPPGSPVKDRVASSVSMAAIASSVSSTTSALAKPVANVCKVPLPEYQHEAMWRVLPNSATVDRPSRLRAYGRWANVYPPKVEHNGVSWHSLKSPASLPLTNEGFPSLQSFQEHYQFQFYDIAVDDVDSMPLPLLLDQMIGLRLQMGFQIAVGNKVRDVEVALPRGNPNRVSTIVPETEAECIGIRVYLTRVGLVHRIAVDEPGTVNLRLYTWIDHSIDRLKSPGAAPENIVKVKTRYDTQYEVISKKFLDPTVQNLNWSMLDLQLSGADDPLLYPSSANTQNLVALRFVVLPSENSTLHSHETLSIEEGHVEGITRIVRTMLKHREAGAVDADFLPQYYTGKLRNAINDCISSKEDSLIESNRLNKQISLEDLAIELQGPMGLEFKDRRWHWKQFSNVFLGHDLVVWLIKTLEDINTTEEAEAYGADLMKREFIRHPENRHPFIHGHYFYEITPKYKKKEAMTPPPPEINTDDSKSDTQRQVSLELPTKPITKGKVHVSGSFVMNIDPRGISRKPERVKVSIDRIHNPKNAYHILLEYLSATPRLIDDYFTNLTRLAAPYGLRLVQVPVANVLHTLEDSPFRSAISLRVNIELNDAEESRWFRHYMLRHCDYILDLQDNRDISTKDYDVLFMWGRLGLSFPQYIHKSGYVLVQVAEDGTLKVTPNTLHLSRSVMYSNANTTSNAEQDCERIIDEIKEVCENKETLETILKEGREWVTKQKVTT